MEDVDKQKKKLEQKKNRLAMEETRLKIKERKMRTRHLIEIGGLITKAKIDSLPTNTLYGALLSLAQQLEQGPDIKDLWTDIGAKQFDLEQRENTPVILTFTTQPEKETRDQIRTLGLRWNKFRSEWYGNVSDIDTLKNTINNLEHELQILSYN